MSQPISLPDYINYFLSLPVNDVIVYYFTAYIGITLIRDLLNTDFNILNIEFGHKFCFGILIIFLVKTLASTTTHLATYLTPAQTLIVSIFLLVLIIFFVNMILEKILQRFSKIGIELAIKEKFATIEYTKNTDAIEASSKDTAKMKREAFNVYTTNIAISIIILVELFNSPYVVFFTSLLMCLYFIIRSSKKFFDFKTFRNGTSDTSYIKLP